VRVHRACLYGAGVDLRTEQPGDIAAVRDVHLSAFGAEGPVVAGLVDDLRATGCLSLVAEVEGEPVGHVMFTRSLLDAPRRLVDVQVLSPLAVRPDHQGEDPPMIFFRGEFGLGTDEPPVPAPDLWGWGDHWG
jgi:putative acetyltransferase